MKGHFDIFEILDVFNQEADSLLENMKYESDPDDRADLDAALSYLAAIGERFGLTWDGQLDEFTVVFTSNKSEKKE